MDKETYAQYADIVKQISILEEKKKEFSTELLSEMRSTHSNQIKCNEGTFSLIERKIWTYSDDAKEQIKGKKAEIKTIEKEDIDSEKAKLEFADSLRFQLKVGE